MAAGWFACICLTGYILVDISAPADVSGDHLFLLAMAKSYVDGHGFRLNPSLGFPHVQDFLYFPQFEFTQRALLWITARLTGNPITAVHLYYIVGIGAIYQAASIALRGLGVRWPLAAVAAVAYVVSPYLVNRAFGHDFLALYYAAPAGMALALWLATASLPGGGGAVLRRPLIAAALFIAGASGVYYAFFTLMFLAVATLAAAATQRRWAPAVAGASMIGVVLVVAAISGFGLDLPQVLTGRAAIPKRAAYEQILYGLNLPTAAEALPFTGHARDAVTDAKTVVPQIFANEGGHEFPGALLTLAMMIAPLVAVAFPFARSRHDPFPPLAPDPPGVPAEQRLRIMGFAALCITFGMLYAARGGLAFVFNIFVMPEIRGTGRIIPFLSFAALVMVCMAAEATAGSTHFWRRWGPAAALALALLACTRPVYLGLAKSQMARYQAPERRALRVSTPLMLAAKDRTGAARVLELPVKYWPEFPETIPGVDPYAALLPYIYDRTHSGTKWSYGANAAQPGFAREQVQLREPEGLPARARTFAYDAILVQKRAYGPGALPLLASLDRQLGAGCHVYDDEVYALYRLNRPGCDNG